MRPTGATTAGMSGRGRVQWLTVGLLGWMAAVHGVEERPPSAPPVRLGQPGAAAPETPEAALVRELAEELGIETDPAAAVPLTFASAGLGSRHLLLLLYVIRDWQGEPQALEASALTWVEPAAMRSLAMPPADVPLVAALERLSEAPARQGG